MRKLLLLLVSVPFFLIADDMDDMFSSDEELIIEITEEEMAEDMETLFLTTEDIYIGGKINFSLSGDIDTDPDVAEKNTTPELTSTLYLDARPEEDFRGFIKGKITIPLADDYSEEKDANGNIVLEKIDPEIFSIQEMFVDYNYDSKVFFRAGKYKINWGVGRYYSPADINVEAIDPDDPDADREGPVSLKSNIPLGLNNLNFYFIAPYGYDSVADTKYAANYSFILGDMELTTGGVYSYDFDPEIALTLSTSLMGIDIYSEAVGTIGDDFTFEGTVGGGYTISSDEVATSLGLNAQYYYNGFESEHKILGSVSLMDILDTGIGLSVSSKNELTESTGVAKASLSYTLLDNFNLSTGVNYDYLGDDPVSFTFDIGLGGGTL